MPVPNPCDCGCRLLVCQNAECLQFVIVPVRQPGYFEQDPTTYVSCVPETACPGVDVSALMANSDALTLTPYFQALVEVRHRPVLLCRVSCHLPDNAVDNAAPCVLPLALGLERT